MYLLMLMLDILILGSFIAFVKLMIFRIIFKIKRINKIFVIIFSLLRIEIVLMSELKILY